jgi:hypothetical protein
MMEALDPNYESDLARALMAECESLLDGPDTPGDPYPCAQSPSYPCAHPDSVEFRHAPPPRDSARYPPAAHASFHPRSFTP